jgi:hypothetical protein
MASTSAGSLDRRNSRAMPSIPVWNTLCNGADIAGIDLARGKIKTGVFDIDFFTHLLEGNQDHHLEVNRKATRFLHMLPEISNHLRAFQTRQQ